MIPKWEDSVAVEDSEAMPRWEDSEPIEAMPTAPPVSDRQERASLITQRGPEARMAQAAQQEAITAAGKDSDEVVMQLQSLVDKGDTGFIDPAVLAQYRHKITFPEQKKGAAKVDPAVSKRIEDRQQTPVEPLPESMFAPSNIAAGIKNAGRDALGYAPEQALALTTQAIDFFPGLMRGAKETARSLWTFAIGEENTQAIEQLSYKIPVLGDILKKGDELLDASGKLRRESSELLMKEAIEQGGMTGAAVASLVESIESTLMTLKTMKGLGVGYGGQAGMKSTLKAAGVRAALMAATTEGLSPSERLKAAGLGFAYQATPALSGTIGKWTKSDAIAKVTDIASNFGITAPQWAGMMDTGYAKAEAAGKPDMGFFYGLLEAIKAAGSDVVFGIMTQAFHEQGKTGAVRAMEDVARKAGVKPRFAEPPAKVAADTVDFKPLGEVETEPVKPLTVEPKKVPDAIPKPVSAEVAPPVAELPAKPTVAPARMPQEPSEPTWEGSRPVTPAEQKAKGLLAWFAAGDRIGMKMERFLKTKGLAWDTLPKRGTPEGNALNAEWRAWDKANIDQPAEPEASKPAEPVAQRGTKLKSGAALDIYFNEQINYGGETRSRGSVIVEMQKDGIPQKQIDAYMMGAKTLAQPAESAGKRASGEKPLTDFEVRYTTKDGNRGKTWVQAEDAQLAVSKAQKQFNEEGTGDKVTSAVKSKMPMTEPVVTKPIPIPGMKEAAAEAEKVAKGPGLAGGPGAAAAASEGEFAPRGTKISGGAAEREIITGTALNKATAEMERASLGLKPADETERKAMAVEWNRAGKTINDDSRAPTRLVDAITSDPTRAVSDADAALLLRHKAQLQNDINKAASEANTAKTEAERSEAEASRDKALAELETLMDAAKTGLTTWGRTGRWAQMIAADDFSLGNMLMRAKSRKGGELTGEEKLKIQMLQKELEKAQKQTQDATKTAQDEAQKQADKVFQDFVTETIARSSKPVSFSEKTLAFIDSQADKAMQRIKERRSHMASGIDPTELADYAIVGSKHLAHGIKDFTSWSGRMVAEFGDYIKPLLKQIWDASRKLTGDYRVKDAGEGRRAPRGKAPTGEAETGAVGRKLIVELMRDEVESGVKDLDTAVRNVHAVISKSRPDITLRQVRDTFSDYGKSSMPSQEPTDVVLRDMRAQSQKISQLEDVMTGKPPLKTGMGRDAPSQRVRELTKQVHAAMKKTGIVMGDPDKRLKSSLDAVKTRLGNSIADLTKAIEKRERMIVNKAQIKYDAEANVLKARRDALRAQYDEMFPKPPMTEEERYDVAVKTAQRSLDQWESKLADAKKGVFAPDVKKGVVATKELMAIRKQRDDARKDFEALRDAAMPDRKDKLALAIYKKRLDNRIADIEGRLKAGVLPKKVEKPERVLDEEAKGKMFQLEKLQDKWKAMQYELQLAQMSRWQKTGMAVRESANTLRALVASFDIGHLRRQGGMHFLSHPIESIKLLPATFRAMRGEEQEFRINQSIKDDPIHLQEKKAGLFFNTKNAGFNAQEEAYRGRWWRAIPGLAASGRAYSAGLNLVRHTMFKRLSATLSERGKLDDESAKTLANFINNWTGRGGLGKFEQSAQGLADVFFSPRLVTSRFKVLLAPFTGFRMYGKSKEARKLIAKEYARYVAGVATYYGAIAAGGYAFLGPPGEDEKWNITFDPLSTQFGKIRIGNTTIDPLSGLQQPLVATLKTLLGREKTAHGDIRQLRGKQRFGARDVSSVIGRYIRSKLSPAAGLTYDLITGKDYMGGPPTIKSVAAGMTPMVARDLYEAVDDMYKEFGEAGIPTGIIVGLLSAVGEGIQTYDEEKAWEKRHRSDEGFWKWE